MMNHSIDKIKFWINAFIPKDISGITKRVPTGRFAGKTMIDGPFPFSDCYLTDQRTFSSNSKAKSRLHFEANIKFHRGIPVCRTRKYCDPSIEIDCEDGCRECKKRGAATGTSSFFVNRQTPLISKLHFECAAGNPCAPSSDIMSKVDFRGTLIINYSNQSVFFEGFIDPFPAYEGYIQINDRLPIPLFKLLPEKRNNGDSKTVWNLTGPASRGISYGIQATRKDLQFNSSIPKSAVIS